MLEQGWYVNSASKLVSSDEVPNQPVNRLLAIPTVDAVKEAGHMLLVHHHGLGAAREVVLVKVIVSPPIRSGIVE